MPYYPDQNYPHNTHQKFRPNIEGHASSSTNHQLGAPMPTILFGPHAWTIVSTYARKARGEVGGFATVKAGRDFTDFEISDHIFLPEQQTTAASVSISASAMGVLLDEVLAAGTDPSQIRLFWHTHPGQVFFSGTDVHTMQTCFPQANWFLGVVLNAKLEATGSLHIRLPLAKGSPSSEMAWIISVYAARHGQSFSLLSDGSVMLSLYDLPVAVSAEPDESIEALIDQEIRRKVRLTPLPAKPGYLYGAAPDPAGAYLEAWPLGTKMGNKGELE